MSGVAISDIVFMLYHIYQAFLQTYSGCINTKTYGMVLAKLILKNLSEFAKRCSIWFSFSIGLIRLLLVKNPMDPFYQNLSKPFTAYAIISGVTLASLLFSSFKASFIVIFESDSMSICNSETKNPVFGVMWLDFLDPDHALFLKYTFTIDSIISTTVPCVLFTFLTIMLVLEMKKVNKNRSKLFSSAKDKDSRNNTQLVLYFTLTFFVALFPLGVNSAFVNLIVEKVGFTVIGSNFGNLLGILYTANTSSHFFVCILISSLYQKTVKDVMSCGRNTVHTSNSSS